VDLTTAYTDAWYRPPDPVDRADERRPTDEQWVLVAAVWLLAMWSSQQAPGWASTMVAGRTTSRDDRQWPEPPPLPEIADASDLSNVTAATSLTSRASSGPDEDVAAELVTLISNVVPANDERGQALVRFLAGQLADRFSNVLRLSVDAKDANAPSSPEPLHLLHRHIRGDTLRLSLYPAAHVEQPPDLATDGPDAALRTRIACIATLLSDMLWVNNNNPVTFRFRIGRLDQADGDLVAAGARWWARNREDADEYDEEEFRPISATDLRAALHYEVRLSLLELLTGEWSGMDQWPPAPAGHLATFLVDDLVDVILIRMGPGAQIASAGYLPVTWPPDDLDEDEPLTTVLLVGGDEVAVLEVDRTC
jgi:hypothetical protein